MNDRVSTYPGRVRLTPVEGQTGVYDMVRADSPTQEGTALNKANLLSDTTASAINTLTGSTPSTPNSALYALTNKLSAVISTISGLAKFEWGSYTGTGAHGSSYPTTITTSFAPKLLLVHQLNYCSAVGAPSYLIVDYGILTTSYGGYWNSDKSLYMKKSSDGKTLYMVEGEATPDVQGFYQYNVENHFYAYFAFG